MAAKTMNLNAVTQVNSRTWQVASRTTEGVVYTVTKASGQLQCNCNAAYQGVPCWHVRAVTIRANDELKWERTRRTAVDAETRAWAMGMLTGKRA